MTVCDVSARTPLGLCPESARRPLYPTRPDPTRPFIRVETPTTSSLSEAGVRDEVVSAPRSDVDSSTIEHLDFTPTCEHSMHSSRHPGDEPAAYIVRVTRPCGCSKPFLINLCHPGWVYAGRGLCCIHCGTLFDRDDMWRIVHVYGGQA